MNTTLELLDNAQAMYIDWVNNFITTAAFADFYGIPEPIAIKIIELGKLVNEDKAYQRFTSPGNRLLSPLRED